MKNYNIETNSVNELLKQINKMLLQKNTKKFIFILCSLYFGIKTLETCEHIGALRELEYLLKEGLITEGSIRR